MFTLSALFPPVSRQGPSPASGGPPTAVRTGRSLRTPSRSSPVCWERHLASPPSKCTTCSSSSKSRRLVLIGCVVLRCGVLCCVALFCSVLFCSVLFCSVLFCSVLFCSVLFYSVLFCSVLLCSVLVCYNALR